MPNDRTFVIVGAGLAGASGRDAAGGGLRRPRGAVGSGLERPYNRPPLSKEYLRGEAEPGRCSCTRRGSTASTTSSCAGPHRHRTGYHDRDADAGRRRAAALRPAAAHDRRRAAPAGGARRRPGGHPVPALHGGRRRAARSVRAGRPAGGDRRGLDRLRGGRVRPPAGLDVTVIAPDQLPLAKSPGRRGRRGLPRPARRARRHMALETGVAALEGDGSGGARPHPRRRRRRLRPGGGRHRRQPRVALAERGRHRRRERRAGRLAPAVQRPGIYAAGDIANAEHPFYQDRVRVEHWATR